jgi:hypothetical protein
MKAKGVLGKGLLPMFQRLRATRLLPCAGAACLLTLVVVLAGCDYNGPLHYYPLPQLHIPHLQWLAALSRMQRADGTHGGSLYGLTTFDRPGSSAPQVILNFDDEDQYMIGLDGSGQHTVNLGDYCLGSAAVTRDGKWIACVSSPDGGNDRLQVAALHASGTSHVRRIGLSPLPSYNIPTRSPSGNYLAVVLSDLSNPCSVAIYSSPPPHATFTPAVQLTAAQFTDQNGFCTVSDMEWSADGRSLLLLDNSQVSAVMTVAITPLLQAFVSTAPQELGSQDVSYAPAQVLPSPSDVLLLNPAGDTVLALSTDQPQQVISINLHTLQATPLFTVPEQYPINAMMWLPNGRQLLIAVGSNEVCVGCYRDARSDVYLYSPPIPPEPRSNLPRAIG